MVAFGFFRSRSRTGLDPAGPCWLPGPVYVLLLPRTRTARHSKEAAALKDVRAVPWRLFNVVGGVVRSHNILWRPLCFLARWMWTIRNRRTRPCRIPPCGEKRNRLQSKYARTVRPAFRRGTLHKCLKGGGTCGCDHTSTNAPDPIRTPQLSVLGRE